MVSPPPEVIEQLYDKYLKDPYLRHTKQTAIDSYKKARSDLHDFAIQKEIPIENRLIDKKKIVKGQEVTYKKPVPGPRFGFTTMYNNGRFDELLKKELIEGQKEFYREPRDMFKQDIQSTRTLILEGGESTYTSTYLKTLGLKGNQIEKYRTIKKSNIDALLTDIDKEEIIIE